MARFTLMQARVDVPAQSESPYPAILKLSEHFVDSQYRSTLAFEQFTDGRDFQFLLPSRYFRLNVFSELTQVLFREVLFNQHHMAMKFGWNTSSDEIYQTLRAHQDDFLEAVRLKQAKYFSGGFTAQSLVLRLHAMLEYVPLRTIRLLDARPSHVANVFPFPLRNIDLELPLLQWRDAAQFVAEEMRAGVVHDDNANGPVFSGKPEQLR